MDPIEVHLERKSIPAPDEKFPAFIRQFEVVQNVLDTKEWREIYSSYYEFDKYELGIKIHETEEEVEAYTAERQVQEIIKCANSFSYFCHKYVKIMHPIMGLLPFRMYKYQRHVISEYSQHRFNILSKFRQGGLTTVSVLWSLWRCMFQTDQQILVMSKTDREAIAAGEMAKRAIQHFPSWLKPAMRKNNDHERQFADTDSTLWFYTPEAARGKAITLLVIDEAAFIPDMAKHWKAMYPVISTGGACCVVSTVNGLGNWYEETYHSAESGENAFNVIDLDYWEHPEYNNPAWVKQTRENLGEKGWLQEVLRSFLGSGETYISADIIGALDKRTRDNEPHRVLFDKWRNRNSEKKLKWQDGALWVWKEPQDGHDYIIGVDCAEGVGDEGDNSSFQIVDMQTLEQVGEFYSNVCPPHVFAKILNEIGYYYNTALIAVENLGPGNAVLSDLQHELAYDNLYYEGKGKQAKPGVKVNRSNRPEYLEALQRRLINNSAKINSRRFVTELKTFIFNAQNGRAEAQKGKHDDAIMAMCICLYVRDSHMRDIPIGADVPDELTKVFKSAIYEEIRKEIMDGSPEDWLEEDREDPEDFLAHNTEELISPVYFGIQRKHEKLLREFGW